MPPSCRTNSDRSGWLSRASTWFSGSCSYSPSSAAPTSPKSCAAGCSQSRAGQFEASDAIGLNATQKYAFIILPQAIKAVIPAIIGRFIALWKDTALLAAISLVNTLEKAKKVLAGQSDIAEGAFFEVYLIVALIYWVVSYLLSRLGSAAESRLGENPRQTR